jgi:uncharacterized protein
MWHLILECVLIAFGAGMIFGVFGGGSGLIMMPGYYFLMRHFHLVTSHQMQMAVGTTAFTSGILGAVAAWQQYRNGNVNFTLVKKMTPGLLIGTVLAVILLNVVPSHFLKRLFGVVVMLVSLWLFFYKMEKDLNHWSLSGVWNHLRTTCIGLLWFLLGVAVFNVPYLYKCKVQLRDAIGSATFMGSAFSLLAGILLMAAGYLTVGISSSHIGYVNTLLCLVSIIPSAIASSLGASISMRLPKDKVKLIYATLIIVVGVLMLGV